MKILYPIELLLSSVFSFSYNLTGHYGYALILMSVCITLITTPIYLVADYWKNQEKKIQDLMKTDIDCIKAHYSKQKQFYLTQACHRIYNYKAWYPLRTSLGILIEIPFFFAAFNVLSNFKGYYGVSFGPIQNLGAPDGLLWTLNLLPIVMTLLNVISSIIYSRSFRLKDNTQPFVLAAVFLLFLYESPSALLIYWSFNNFFSLVKNIIIELVKKNKEKIQIVNLWKEIKKNRNIVLYILCTLLYIVFTFLMSFDHRIIKYCFLLLSMVQVGLFVFFYVLKKRKLNIRYIIVYCIYIACSFSYFKRSNIFDFDTALMIICILNCILFFNYFKEPITINPIFIKNRKTEVIASPLLFCLIFTFLLPLQIYLFNKQEFPINFFKILLTLGITFVVATVFLCCISLLVFKKSDYINKALIFILVLYFFNGLFLRLNAGMMSEFGFQNDLVIINPSASLFFKDFIIILFSIYITSYLFSKKRNFLIPLYIISIIAFSFSIIRGAIKYKNIKIEKTEEVTQFPEDTEKIHTFTTEGTNVYIFMSDMFNGNYMEKILAEKPEIKETLSGFTWYRDCLSNSSNTRTSMPALYGGNDYSLYSFNGKNISAIQNTKNSIKAFYEPYLRNNYDVSLELPSSYFEPEIQDNNLHVFSRSAYSEYFAKLHSIENSNSEKIYLCQVLPFFQMFPHSSKKYIYNKGVWNNPNLQLRERLRWACSSVSHAELIPELIKFTNEKKNYVKFFYSLITHYPWTYNSNGKLISNISELDIDSYNLSYYSAEKSIECLMKLVKLLKDNNAYNNTVIIFLSDHGNQLKNNTICNKNIPSLTNSDYQYHLSMCNTVLLIKGLNENNEFTISDAQLQNSDVYDYIHEYIFNDSNNFSKYLSYDAENPRTRIYSYESNESNDYYNLYSVPSINYSVKGALVEPESWSMYD